MNAPVLQHLGTFGTKLLCRHQFGGGPASFNKHPACACERWQLFAPPWQLPCTASPGPHASPPAAAASGTPLRTPRLLAAAWWCCASPAWSSSSTQRTTACHQSSSAPATQCECCAALRVPCSGWIPLQPLRGQSEEDRACAVWPADLRAVDSWCCKALGSNRSSPLCVPCCKS